MGNSAGCQFSGRQFSVVRCGGDGGLRQTAVRFFGAFEVTEGELRAAEFGVVVVIESEGDIQSVAGKQFGLLNALGHAPAEGIVGD